MDDLEGLLRDKIKPELNFLYTEKPAWREGGGDFGWFCREHAYHGLLLCRMLRVDASIILGDVSLHDSNGTAVLTTFGEDCDHAWLRVDDVCPVDLSFTLDYFGTGTPRIGLIYGAGRQGDYLVTHQDSSEALSSTVSEGLHHLRYAKREVVSMSAVQLIEDPFLFLRRPRGYGLTTVLGKDIFDKVTLHLYRVAKGEIGPYFRYVSNGVTALKRIKTKTSGASQRVRELLGAE